MWLNHWDFSWDREGERSFNNGHSRRVRLSFYLQDPSSSPNQEHWSSAHGSTVCPGNEATKSFDALATWAVPK